MGVTREAVFEIAADKSIPATEARLTTFDLYNADEIFLCSTAGGIFPITEVDGRSIGTGLPGPMTARINELYMALLKSGEKSTPAYE